MSDPIDPCGEKREGFGNTFSISHQDRFDSRLFGNEKSASFVNTISRCVQVLLLTSALTKCKESVFILMYRALAKGTPEKDMHADKNLQEKDSNCMIESRGERESLITESGSLLQRP